MGQTQLFRNYDFKKGGYYILGVFSVSDRNGLRDTLGEFYTDSIPILNQFKKEWVFKKPGLKYACGYHYIVSVCKNGIALESFYINLNCSEIVSGTGYFYFDTEKLRMFKGRLKKPHRVSKDFTSLTEARAYRSSILSDSTLIMTPTPAWTRFEGEFDFTFKCPERNKSCLEKEDSLKEIIKQEISTRYSGEDFELSDRGGSSAEIDQIIRCNKTLSDKFNLYYRDTVSYFGRWRPYKLNLTTYWTNKPK